MAHKFKGNVRVDGSFNLPNQDASEVLVTDSSNNVTSSGISTTALQTVVDDAILQDGSRAMEADLPFGGNKATGLADPTNDQDAATKKYVDDEITDVINQIPTTFRLQGNWNANTNTPTLASGVNPIDPLDYPMYIVSVAGNTTLDGNTDWQVGDKAYFANGQWYKADNNDAVTSVNGASGIVVLDTDDINEGATNLYFTDERAQDAVGTILTDSDTIDFTYDGAGNTIEADVRVQNSITSDVNGVQLSGDEATPGNSHYYGTDGSGTKGFHELPPAGSVNDIQETTFSAANNQVAAANVTGLAFANAEVRSFKAWVSVSIDATADLFEAFELQGVQKGASWDLAVQSVGDESNFVFTITTAGQVQYTSGNEAGHVSTKVQFRAITTEI